MVIPGHCHLRQKLSLRVRHSPTQNAFIHYDCHRFRHIYHTCPAQFCRRLLLITECRVNGLLWNNEQATNCTGSDWFDHIVTLADSDWSMAWRTDIIFPTDQSDSVIMAVIKNELAWCTQGNLTVTFKSHFKTPFNLTCLGRIDYALGAVFILTGFWFFRWKKRIDNVHVIEHLCD